MKIIIVITIFITSGFCYGHEDLLGLFGRCDSDYSGYVCQQILFKEDKTFTFYDLLHLNGWTLSEGVWKMNGDTVILNSTWSPFTLSYKGVSTSDSIIIFACDSVEPLSFAKIYLNSQKISTQLSATIKYPRALLDTVYIAYLDSYRGPIIVDKEKLNGIDTLQINMEIDFANKAYFKHEKWLLQNQKLFLPQDSIGNFAPNRYIDKVDLKDLKYRKDYR